MSEIVTEIKEFLKKFGYQALEWDGEEITLFTPSGEPFSWPEFIEGSATDLWLATLEIRLRGKGMSKFRVDLDL